MLFPIYRDVTLMLCLNFQNMTHIVIKKVQNLADLKYVQKLQSKRILEYYTNLLVNILMRELVIQVMEN